MAILAAVSGSSPSVVTETRSRNETSAGSVQASAENVANDPVSRADNAMAVVSR